MTFTSAKVLMSALAIALFMTPAASFAQGYDGVMGAQKGYKGGNPNGMGSGGGDDNADSDNAGGGDADTGVGGFGDGGSGGFDEMYAGSEGAGKDLYSYVGNERSNPSNKREKAAAETRKKRDEMVSKMKANSERLLKQQKERAWKAANRGKEYPGEEEASDGEGGYGDEGDGGSNDEALFGKDSGGGVFGEDGDTGGYGGDGDSGGDSGDSGGDGGSDY